MEELILASFWFKVQTAAFAYVAVTILAFSTVVATAMLMRITGIFIVIVGLPCILAFVILSVSLMPFKIILGMLGKNVDLGWPLTEDNELLYFVLYDADPRCN